MRKSNQVGAHFDKIANSYDLYKKNNQYYYDNLKILLASFIHSKSKVLEIGCGTGDLIASLKPEYGMGFDISNKMIAIAKRKHRNIHFSTHWPKQKFDYIFMSDVVEHLEYPDETFRKISKLMNCKSIFICTMANPKLEPILMIAEKMKLKMPEGPHYRIKYKDLRSMIEDSGMEIREHNFKLLIPIKIPLITYFANKYLERFFRKYAFIEYFTATKS
ncbi:MAG: Methyltransferase type 12 [Microgenomates group bacterium GW2011_GWC1_39_7b]|uniref:Methyltransferase type 12 n=3 Tax=Candidatus Woeseibacteriota TaxID=1752722 RepID=A0A0G0PR07_9BACT|nr:MAG: Methyltransferase type 12 [Candidatus Woesebacteria bacterium GW2011_GWB1_39_10]KKR26579.1 MAG: Methyltransferase type 12 [Microgenomates group bacterium GW2011_GWC1_39_7b]KKR74400.1 MAG: Methyltransferase type 12 [Candidatus Woesebacteria bacterium GW2011_GWA2_40_7]KKS90782.1 MAG: Methyltransferase type 12 [Candidatus Woesebacteria bacterium GW2011_GWA1_43_12]